MENKIKPSNIDLSSFNVKKELNPKVWGENDKLKPEVKKRLLKIANDFLDSIEMIDVDVEDVVFTGSLANYNWSKYSDVDLHIVLDFKDIEGDKEFIQDFFKTKTTYWNLKHNIKVYGYDIELYVQDSEEPHISTGVYSILYDEWLIEPSVVKPTFDSDVVKKKSSSIINYVNQLEVEMNDEEKYGDVSKKIVRLRDKIKKYRQCGLDSEGEFSNENIVFKVLRRNGVLDKMEDLKIVSYDKDNTLNEVRVKSSERVKIYEDDEWLVVHPLSFNASCKYGHGSSWCTSTPSNDSNFNQYSKDGVLIYYINKNHNHIKYAEFIDFNGKQQFFTSDDKEMGSFPEFLTKIQKEIKNDVFNLLKKKKEELINQFKNSPSLKWLNQLWSKMKEFKIKKYPQSTYYGKSKDDLCFEKDEKREEFWIDYTKVWSKIEMDNGWDYLQTQDFFKKWLGEHLKLGDLTPLKLP